MNTGLFISLEGIDGAGKSTHVAFIKNYLDAKGKKVLLTREPGGTILGEEIRNLLLNSSSMCDITELLLYFASRQEIIHQVIVPALTAGTCIIADRFVDAAIAYQGAGRKIGIEKVKLVYSLLEPQLKTDLTFLFDAPIEIAMARLHQDSKKDRIEQEPTEFFARVQSAYHKLANAEPQRIKVINTNQSIEASQQQIIYYLDNLLGKKNVE